MASQRVSMRDMACVISTLPSSPTGDGALTPPICGGAQLKCPLKIERE